MQIVFGDYTLIMADILNLRTFCSLEKPFSIQRTSPVCSPSHEDPAGVPASLKLKHVWNGCKLIPRDFEIYFPPFQAATGFSSFPVCFENQHAET